MKPKIFSLLIFVISIQSLYAQKTILWKIEKAGEAHTSYIFGVLNEIGNSFVDERPQIIELLSKSDVAVFESIEDRQKTVIDVMNRRPEDFSYRKILDKKDVEYLESKSKAWTVPVSKIFPAELTMKLSQVYSSEFCGGIKTADTWKNLSDYLEYFAKNKGIKLQGLEKSSDQINAVNSNQELNWSNAKDLISNTINTLQVQNKTQICTVFKVYMSDMNFNYRFDDKCGEGFTFGETNKNWLPIIDEIVQNNNAFIVVGIIRLFGDCGIISQLRKQGYTVTPVALNELKG